MEVLYGKFSLQRDGNEESVSMLHILHEITCQYFPVENAAVDNDSVEGTGYLDLSGMGHVSSSEMF